jgi:hypothetical protein
LAVEMMAEGSETPNGEQGMGPEGRPRRGEGDLFAERRARRAAESGEVALMRRAEAAEATVQTLERHVASLQQRLLEVEEERQRTDELLDAEREGVLEREHELRRVKQREYAEQQLRVEAEDRRARSERDSRAEIDRLTRRLGASEHHARELSQRLESAQRELDEAEQAAVAELGELRSAGELQLRARFAELERHALEIRREIDAERTVRVEAERRLAEMRAGYRRMELLVAELKGTMAQLRAATTREPGGGGTTQLPVAPAEHREELADALAAAVERLRARAEASASEPEELADTSAPRPSAELDRPSAVAEQHVLHKHSMSLLGRARLRRKQRRERRAAAAERPNINVQ